MPDMKNKINIVVVRRGLIANLCSCINVASFAIQNNWDVFWNKLDNLFQSTKSFFTKALEECRVWFESCSKLMSARDDSFAELKGRSRG